jgi:hypothetical protein
VVRICQGDKLGVVSQEGMQAAYHVDAGGEGIADVGSHLRRQRAPDGGDADE